MKFSERKGLKEIKHIVQKDSMDDELKNSLWNVLYIYKFNKSSFMMDKRGYRAPIKRFLERFSLDFLTAPIHKFPTTPYVIRDIFKNLYFDFSWNEIYDFIEYTVQYFNESEFTEEMNRVLERELSGYRFVENILTDIISSEEIAILQEALTDEDFPGVRNHLKRALELMSDRKKPDYRNSIKESISAVEGIAKHITKNRKSTLSDALKVLKKTYKLHQALEEGFIKIYGYTNAEDGIRHSMLDEPNLGYDDSKFFLISCTAFITYLKSKIH